MDRDANPIRDMNNWRWNQEESDNEEEAEHNGAGDEDDIIAPERNIERAQQDRDRAMRALLRIERARERRERARERGEQARERARERAQGESAEQQRDRYEDNREQLRDRPRDWSRQRSRSRSRDLSPRDQGSPQGDRDRPQGIAQPARARPFDILERAQLDRERAEPDRASARDGERAERDREMVERDRERAERIQVLFALESDNGEEEEWYTLIDDALGYRIGILGYSIHSIDSRPETPEPPRLTKSEIDVLPTAVHNKNMISDGEEASSDVRCSICLKDFKTGDQKRILPCVHNFHIECGDKWLRMNATCPVCRHLVK
ncbi:NEP1-interacting protein 1 [Biomphalaria pfeifferi]|uniref:NEP1-interacting protein 1 n=1 Tax=Biomphalaria pfeifferi TaxID=112525 RepID=A0AAD8BGR2_BIOPF|nr:NEP1-interacting protein 1 [Biomphalaria pfeifferi]